MRSKEDTVRLEGKTQFLFDEVIEGSVDEQVAVQTPQRVQQSLDVRGFFSLVCISEEDESHKSIFCFVGFICVGTSNLF